ncbi:MAG: MFS transporter [Chloroflexota bacterium]|nr:MFS transporter [Chloroflexota bacterium]
MSNIGTWVQNVGGAWLMTTLTADPLPVALMSTATSLPVFLVGLPAGSLADRVDRRRLLLVTQTWMLLSVSLLALLTLLGMVTPAWLLGLTFALGLGAAFNSPTWAATLPDLVSRRQLATAVSVNSLGYNVARAVGPAIGGFLVAAIGPASTFIVNGLSFLATIAVVATWRPGVSRPSAPDREHLARAMLTGVEYCWRAWPQRIVLTRSLLWMLSASALWGLLPLVARVELGLDAPGYGFLVTCVGAGAIGGAFALPHLRGRWSTNRLLVAAIVTFGSMLLVLAWVRFVPVVWLMLALGGAAWTSSNQNFQISVQLTAPGWVRARAIAMYLLTFQGGQAIGSAIWGAVAARVGNPVALSLAASGLLLSLAAARRWPVEDQA